MTLRFDRSRRPTRPDQLTDIEAAQIEQAGRLYDGRLLPISRRLRPPDPSARFDDELSFHGLLDGWDVLEGAELRYTAWLYCGDSGTIFRAGTTEPVAEVIQGWLDNCASEAIRQALQDAVDTHPRMPGTRRIRIARSRRQ